MLLDARRSASARSSHTGWRRHSRCAGEATKSWRLPVKAGLLVRIIHVDEVVELSARAGNGVAAAL